MELAIDRLRAFGTEVYRRARVPAGDAATVTDVQLAADARGVDTHGFQRLPWYVEAIAKGEDNPKPDFRVLKETPSSVLLDADRAIGQLACVRLMELTIAKARTTGVAVGTSRNSNDWGCGAYYPLTAARQGFVCFGTTTSVPTLAPFGARTRAIGNNPMVFAVPRREAAPIVLDMALTPVALGKVMRANAEGQTIPLEWGFRDSDGVPTTDPRTALRGIIPAIGGYKGTGLAMMMNILAGVLPRGFHSSAVAPGRRGQFFFVLDPALFGDADSFLDGVEAMADEIKRADPLPGEQVYLPGEIEEVRERETLARGTISYPPSVARGLQQVGESLGVTL